LRGKSQNGRSDKEHFAQCCHTLGCNTEEAEFNAYWKEYERQAKKNRQLYAYQFPSYAFQFAPSSVNQFEQIVAECVLEGTVRKYMSKSLFARPTHQNPERACEFWLSRHLDVLFGPFS